ncbi:hypothetical protein K439DRAFT_1618435 [Ramaria rubella]|nr:hypothetical protein K439DRAFT_1618435 [Ramaria rubella]
MTLWLDPAPVSLLMTLFASCAFPPLTILPPVTRIWLLREPSHVLRDWDRYIRDIFSHARQRWRKGVCRNTASVLLKDIWESDNPEESSERRFASDRRVLCIGDSVPGDEWIVWSRQRDSKVLYLRADWMLESVTRSRVTPGNFIFWGMAEIRKSSTEEQDLGARLR